MYHHLVTCPQPLPCQIFTSMFMHGGWLHTIGTMLFLWISGDNVEDRSGHFRYLGFYLVCGVVALFTQQDFILESSIPITGAPGAIAGVPRYMYNCSRTESYRLAGFPGFVHLPAPAVIGFWVFLQFFHGIGSLICSAPAGLPV